MRHHWVRRRAVLGLALAAALLAGCGGGPTATGPAAAATGDPQPGGTLTMVNGTEPANLDPAQFNNGGPTHGAIGNALYGELLVTDPQTGALLDGAGMAQSLTTTDGTTWTLKLRPGLVFSDGTPLDAAAVKFNWDRLKDPKIAASPNLASAAGIADSTVTDPQTLTFTLRRPTFQFAQDITATSMNWLASPTALAAGPEAFTAHPVGAGPFTLTSWIRGDSMTLAKNPTYWDAPRPYLDGLVIRSDTDSMRRLSTVQAGQAELAVGTAADQMANAEAGGLVVTRQKMSGANLLIFNTAAPPFDDIRARTALSVAVDWQANNQAIYGGAADVPATLMTESSPFYDPDLTLPTPDPQRAQQLFDQLAAEGKPVKFTLLSPPTTDAIKLTQSVQAQLAAFKNVTVDVQNVEFTAWLQSLGAGSWQMSVFGIPIVDPEPQLGRFLTTGSPTNFTKISDPDLDAAISTGRLSTDVAERKAAYQVVQEKVRELVPFLAYQRPAVGFISTPAVGGIQFYGNGSLRFENIWLQQNGS